MKTELSFKGYVPDGHWKWPPTTDGIVTDGKVDRSKLVEYLVQVCTGKNLKMTTAPIGCTFTVYLGRELKREKVTFSLPSGPTPMVKITVPFSIEWQGPMGSGSCSGKEQLFFPYVKKGDLR